LAFSKQRKGEMLAEYTDWLKQSKAVFVLEFTKLGMKDVDILRAKVREAGGKAHVVKNTIMVLALQEVGIQVKSMEGSLLFNFAYNDPPALAKVMIEVTKNSEILKLRNGYLGTVFITAQNVKSLADLPPLPILRAQLLGVLQAPAGQLVRTVAEPGRQVARIFQAYVDRANTPADV
jgi:large subunit ribosomal protein L10